MIHECDNCGWSGSEEELGCVMADMADFFERVTPGCPVPSGDCPECRACCYPLDQREEMHQMFPDLVTHLKCALDYYQMFRDSSPVGPTEADDIASCQAALAKATKLLG